MKQLSLKNQKFPDNEIFIEIIVLANLKSWLN